MRPKYLQSKLYFGNMMNYVRSYCKLVRVSLTSCRFFVNPCFTYNHLADHCGIIFENITEDKNKNITKSSSTDNEKARQSKIDQLFSAAFIYRRQHLACLTLVELESFNLLKDYLVISTSLLFLRVLTGVIYQINRLPLCDRAS